MAPTLRPLEDVSLAEAQTAFLMAGEPLDSVTVPLVNAHGSALAAPVHAPISLPPHDNSAMDGYALRASDVAGACPEQPVLLDVVGEAAAGHAFSGTVRGGEAVRIMTGAPLPADVDTVLPNEEATARDRHLVVTAPVVSGRHVRRIGEDVRIGAPILDAGVALGPAQLALLAALGFHQVNVVRRPRVAVLTTGDELCMPGEPRGEGGIYNANLFALCAQIQEAHADPVPFPAAADRPDAIGTTLVAASGADAVVTSAGVCAGRHDHVATVVSSQGQYFAGCLRLRPARHVGLGQIAGKPVFALPGNPAASLIAFELLVRPAIMRMGGHQCWRRPQVRATLVEPINYAPGVTQVFWVRLEATKDGYRASLAGPQGAGRLSTGARADGLLMVPERSQRCAAGDIVSVQLLTGIAPIASGA